jgi:hypothetical protein
MVMAVNSGCARSTAIGAPIGCRPVISSLTGEWWGSPPWLWRIVRLPGDPRNRFVARAGREWISGGVMAVGVALAAVGACPGRVCESLG